MVRYVTHELFGKSLVIPELLSAGEIACASIADECRWVITLVLFNNMLPSRELATRSANLSDRASFQVLAHLSSANFGKYVIAHE